ncbi:exonuclease family protein [Escherichia coli]|uniref:Exonuclease family protein n=1 Tax=Escherichia coli TaxID=562 RepID=A0A2X3K0V0_ECOLX|nr:exonuclease family protein [Escherichia coli]
MERISLKFRKMNPEEMEGTAHQHKENTGGNQHHASDSETGEASDPLIKANGHHNLTSTSRAGIHLMIDLETMGKIRCPDYLNRCNIFRSANRRYGTGI